jgi:aerobic-type carbon monoxide dehydrogenase small subunit (CoxS/CutS family)
VSVDVVLNGRATALRCEPADMLLDVLRAHGLTSVRETCRIGVCGTCTVLLDGLPVRSCLLLAVQADGRAVTTVWRTAGCLARTAATSSGSMRKPRIFT